jgi:FAD:protein FMN transferase
MRPESHPRTIQHQEVVMGTVVTFDLFRECGVSPSGVLPHLARAVTELHRADKVFSTWKTTSPFSQLRRGEISLGEAPLVVTEVLEACRHAREISGGFFNPWAMPGGIDPSGYVKGWATARALDALRDADLDGAMVDSAGDIATFGSPSPHEIFRVAVAEPDSPLEMARVVELSSALATSDASGHPDRFVNPRTGAHDTAVASASVTGPDLGLADALATALCIGGDEVRLLIEELEGYEAFTIGHDGERAATTHFPFAHRVGADA